eukprot:TRINITY_DN17696_c0_g1_i1.p1 TRINITY_DN17696_c0_g1~~TRINITY_DN17696_c0_g1_i1.p1  ORF type:complete len:440 (+),score=78.92 TRINITY_DN17696_c0_g1_i1:173-1321(+)
MFDKVALENILVSKAELEEASTLISDELKTAIGVARTNIHAFHASQKEEIREIETSPGVRCWRRSVPMGTVGLYIPGGTAALFSTVLMLATPAQIAGCTNIVLCTPPDRTTGKVHPAVLYCAKLCGVTSVYKVGGVQAIAAMAYGTESIPRVDKIFGPGNQYVTCAKSLVAKQGTAIDMPAGPSEVLVIADATANPVFAAADLLSQAEHGTDSQVILVTDTELVARNIAAEVERQLAVLPRRDIAQVSVGHSKCIVVPTLDDAIELSNQYAPEHLILTVADAEVDRLASKVQNAGSVFLGHYSPEAVGDYASGTNHTLPTNGHARAYSGVSLDSFVKKITFQHLSPEGLKRIGSAVEVMAAAEELVGHKMAVTHRLDALSSQ